MGSTMPNGAARTAAGAAIVGDEGEAFVTFTVIDQRFGVPVSRVQDILMPERIAPVPLAPPAIRGAINLRGRIVTVIDVRTRLGLPARHDGGEGGMANGTMGVTVEHRGEFYTLLVDRIGDIVQLPPQRWEDKPSTLDPAWRDMTSGVFRLEEGLMVVLDVDRLLNLA
jgi:purine-binding chemotaxis protein CheW